MPKGLTDDIPIYEHTNPNRKAWFGSSYIGLEPIGSGTPTDFIRKGVVKSRGVIMALSLLAMDWYTGQDLETWRL